MTNQLPLWETDPVRFLLELSFPPPALIQARRSMSGDAAPHSAEAAAYQASLKALSTDELHTAVSAKRTLIDELAEMRAKYKPINERFREQSTGFNKPSAWADHFEWAQLAGWRAEEAVALSLNRNPDVVTLHAMKGVAIRNTKFGDKYTRRERLIYRAVASMDLHDPMRPTSFLKWADQLKVDVPRGMRRAILELHGRASDAALQTPPPIEDDLKTSERNSLLKIILGMALQQYSFDPDAARSSTVPQILEDLAASGIKIGEDTVRKYLREAADKFWEREAD